MYNGEFLGVTKAVEYANKIAKPGLNFKVYFDNQAGLHLLKTPSDNPGQDCQIRAIRASKSIIDQGASIFLNWITGHTDVNGNEEADDLAKAATKICSSSNKTSFAFAGTLVKQIQNREWKRILNNNTTKPSRSPSSHSTKFPWKISSKLRIPARIKRATASAFYPSAEAGTWVFERIPPSFQTFRKL